MADVGDLELTVATRGNVSDYTKDYALEKVAHLVAHVREPVLFGQIRLIAEPNPARERPAVAEATLDINGTPVRAQVAARSMDEAIDLLEDRLRRRLRRHGKRLHREGHERRWTGRASEHEWRHGDLPTQRPEYFDRPLDEREIVRHKSFALEPMTVDEAAFDLDMLGHDFYLFTEIGTGADCVLCYDDSHGLVLMAPERVSGDPLAGAAVPVRASTGAPRLAVGESIERLESGGERFVFFIDPDSGRGNVVYHRYDGHYGLITPAT